MPAVDAGFVRESTAVNTSSNVADEVRLETSISLVLILCSLAVIAVWLTRSIVVPLADAVDVAERIAQRDLTQAVQVTGQDEPAMLLRALSRMQAPVGVLSHGI